MSKLSTNRMPHLLNADERARIFNDILKLFKIKIFFFSITTCYYNSALLKEVNGYRFLIVLISFELELNIFNLFLALKSPFCCICMSEIILHNRRPLQHNYKYAELTKAQETYGFRNAIRFQPRELPL